MRSSRAVDHRRGAVGGDRREGGGGGHRDPRRGGGDRDPRHLGGGGRGDHTRRGGRGGGPGVGVGDRSDRRGSSGGDRSDRRVERRDHRKSDDDHYGQSPGKKKPKDAMDEDDNAAPEIQSEVEESENPLMLALDDLEGRVVTAVDDVKTHTGERSGPDQTVHQELATLLRPVLEVAAHTGPSVARTYYSPVGVVAGEGVEASCEEVYERLVSDLVLPILLEMAQAERIPSKIAAALEFFHSFWKEIHKAGSWLDDTSAPQIAGPYGPGGSSRSSASAAQLNTPTMRAMLERRKAKRLTREGEILRYWVQASMACTVDGKFTSNVREDAVAGRGVIAASASFRPALQHISLKIQDADDKGAARLYKPLMQMVQGVLKKLFVTAASSTGDDSGTTGESLRSACIKFLEIVALSCSMKGQQQAADRRRGRGVQTQNKDFSLEDLPAGHPIITREALELISDYAFSVLRGFVLLGGQAKVMELEDTTRSTEPSAQVVAILKPAALAFLEVESRNTNTDDLDAKLDRSQLDFSLAQKSYTIAINAVAMLATNRPGFYRDAAISLAKRAVDPPVEDGESDLSATAVKALFAQLKACCLTLLRNSLSVTSKSHEILRAALERFAMKIQADKAFKMAQQTADLRTAGRAARNRAAMFYEWEDTTRSRKRETDDALAQLRAAKKARGLGSGIQLPTSMVDAAELILLNLSHLPDKRPTGGAAASKNRKRPVTLDFVVDAILSNGASLIQDEGIWYDRDGGNAWKMRLDGDDPQQQKKIQLDSKIALAGECEHDKSKLSTLDTNAKKLPGIFQSQCKTAASQAFGRIIKSSTINAQDDATADFGNHIASRLAWTLQNVGTSSELKPSFEMSKESAASLEKQDGEVSSDLVVFLERYPLVASCLCLQTTQAAASSLHQPKDNALANSILNEAYMMGDSTTNDDDQDDTRYEDALKLLIACTVHSAEVADKKPNDVDPKRVAALATSALTQQLAVLPKVTPASLELLCNLCNMEDITQKAQEASRRTSQQTIAATAALNATKQAAEKRGTAILVALRDVAFQRSEVKIRKSAIDCAAGIASGTIPSSHSMEEKALKLVMNILYPKSNQLSSMVMEGATLHLQKAATYAIEKYGEVQKANKEAEKDANKAKANHNKPLVSSDTEKEVLDRVRKSAILFMALCVRKPEMIQTLMSMSCQKKADVLAKAVREQMPRLARAMASKHGAASIAIEVASMSSSNEIPMVLAFLESLAPTTTSSSSNQEASEELIEACHQIQESKLTKEGKKDPRFVIPVVHVMKRASLVKEIPEFVQADDRVFLAALVRMGERVARHALVVRDEPDPEKPLLLGMTHTEQLVFLHKMDFASVGIPQKRYLAAIRLCLDDDEVFTDSVVMAAMDYLSGTFLQSDAELPLAYMRTIMLTCSKHESLHNWICHTLLPRLVEGEVYKDRRQWEGWMRCARMLERPGASGVSSRDAISRLPPDQLVAYRTKYPAES